MGKTHGEAGQWFSLVPVDQFVADPSLDCPSSTSAPTTAAPTTPAPTEANTASTVDLDGLSSQCTEDGSNVLATEFFVQNVKDSSVMADDGSGTLVLQVMVILSMLMMLMMLIVTVMTVMLMFTMMFLMQKRDSSSLSASSLQKWQAAPLCNGKFKVVKLGKDFFSGLRLEV